jgi:bifunctional DNA-binding transcriptional regulator/antitoxin component of YhaV-PrlF toxin-antitoxin module
MRYVVAKVTSKLRVAIPKAIATRHSIEPSDEVEWTDAGDAIRSEPVEKRSLQRAPIEDRLKWFDDATDRQRLRECGAPTTVYLAWNGARMDARGTLPSWRPWLTLGYPPPMPVEAEELMNPFFG